MKRTAFSFALGCVAILGGTAAQAQVSYSQPQPRGRYGGGLIELLMTGASSAGSRPAYDPFTGAEPPVRAATAPAWPAAPAWPGGGEARILRGLDPIYRRQLVAFDGPDAPGSIVVDTNSKFLYHVQPGGRAMRYGIGVGRPGFSWAGTKTISAKREWPDWTPPPEMLKRRPDLPRHMAGGPANPLGARALYLGSSLYRIHGTNEPTTIGQNVSSGCIRMMNEDVSDLYEHVRVGTRVRVI